MFIKVDYREKDFVTTMNLLFKEHNHVVELENLPLGDIILTSNNKYERIIFERKSLYDLAASIKDGRYNEQSYRLNNYHHDNHNIIYIIEGDLERYNATKGRMDKKTLYSALIALNYFKGFSVMRTKNINETCELVVNFANKLQKEEKKKPYYSTFCSDSEDHNNNGNKTATLFINTSGKKDENESKNENETETESNNKSNVNERSTNEKSYCEVMKKHKKNNITIENIGEIMLSNIPSVSSKSAITIMKKYKTIKNLIKELQLDEACLNDIKMSNENGQTRKISKQCIENIKIFLLT